MYIFKHFSFRFDKDMNNKVDFGEFIEFYSCVKAKYVNYPSTAFFPAAFFPFHVLILHRELGFSFSHAPQDSPKDVYHLTCNPTCCDDTECAYFLFFHVSVVNLDSDFLGRHYWSGSLTSWTRTAAGTWTLTNWSPLWWKSARSRKYKLVNKTKK